MANRLIEELKLVSQYLPLLRDNFSTEATGFATEGYDGCLFLIHIGATDVTVDFHVEESDNNSTYVDISGAVITQISATGDNVILAIDINLLPGARKRYLRGVLVTADGTLGANVAAIAILYKAAIKPTTSGASEVVKV